MRQDRRIHDSEKEVRAAPHSSTAKTEIPLRTRRKASSVSLLLFLSLSLSCCSSPSSGFLLPQSSRTASRALVLPYQKGSDSLSSRLWSYYGGGGREDEASLRQAYDAWRDFYSSPNNNPSGRVVSRNFDALRYQHFKDNYLALQRANQKAVERARQQNQPPPPPLQLNEYGDCSAQEYKELINQSTTTSSSSSSSSTGGYTGKPPSSLASFLTKDKSSNNAGNSNGQGVMFTAPYPSSASYNPLTPPPTATPWSGSDTTNYNNNYDMNYRNGASHAYSSNGRSSGDTFYSGSTSSGGSSDGGNHNKMDPSTAYQMNTDGTYSYVPGGKSVAQNPSRTHGLESYASTYRSNENSGTEDGYPSGSSSSSMGGYSYSTTSGGGGIGGSAGPSYSGGYSFSTDSSTPPTPPGSFTPTASFYNGAASTSSVAPPPPQQQQQQQHNGSYSSDPYPPRNGEYSSPPRPFTNNDPYGVTTEETPPQLSPEEQAALDRARKRHEQIPKAVFDEDESEDENTDSTWANFGMPKQRKIKREKIDFGEPILNGVSNGGSIGLGGGTTTTPSTSYDSNYSGGVGGGTFSYSPYDGSSSSSTTGGAAFGSSGPTSIYDTSFASSSSMYSRAAQTSYSSPTTTTTTTGGVEDRIRQAYQDWCRHHNKVFEESRLSIFKGNFLQMEQYCQQNNIPEPKQLNQYADLSQDEFKAVKTPPSRRSDTPDWILETPESKIESKEEFLTFGPRWGKDPPPGAAALLNRDAVDPVTGGKTDFQGEKRMRMAYQEWCNRHSKRFEESRLPIFTGNFVAMEQYCMTQNIPVKPLNEYADLSPDEYRVALQERGQQDFPQNMPPPGMSFGGQPQGQRNQQQGGAGYSYAGECGVSGREGMPPPSGSYSYSRDSSSSPGIGVMAPPPQYEMGPPFPGYDGPPPRQEGYGSAMAPGGNHGMPSTGGTGGTIPPVNIANGPQGGAIPQQQQQQQEQQQYPRPPPPPPRKSEAQFKAEAEARLKAFSQAKKERNSIGQERLKRFADLKKHAKLVSIKSNITLIEATRQVFREALSNRTVAASTSTSNTTVVSIEDEDGEMEGKPAVRVIATIQEIPRNETSKADAAAVSPHLTTTAAISESEDRSSNSTSDAASKQRAVVDLSAVLSIEKQAIKKDPKPFAKAGNMTASSSNSTGTTDSMKDQDEKSARHRSHYHKNPSPSKASDNAKEMTPEESQADRAKRLAAEAKAKVKHEKKKEDSLRDKSKSLESELKNKTKEEEKLKAEMEAIQNKLKSFEAARKKAEAEAKSKAAEAKKLKEALAKAAEAKKRKEEQALALKAEQQKMEVSKGDDDGDNKTSSRKEVTSKVEKEKPKEETYNILDNGKGTTDEIPAAGETKERKEEFRAKVKAATVESSNRDMTEAKDEALSIKEKQNKKL